MSAFEAKEVAEQRAVVVDELNKLTLAVRNDNRDFSAEESQKFDKLDEQRKLLTTRLETIKRLDIASKLETDPKQPEKTITRFGERLISREDKNMAFKAQSLTAAGLGHLIKREFAEAAEKCGTNLSSTRVALKLAEPRDLENAIPGYGNRTITRAQTSSVGSQGGFLMNDGLFVGLEKNLKWFGGARQVAKVFRTETGEPLSWGYRDDVANKATIQGQAPTAPSNVGITYQKKTIGEYTYVTPVYPISIQFLQDSQIDVASEVGEALGERLGRGTNTDYTTGTGNSLPSGFLTDASAGLTASSQSFTYADLVKFFFSIDRAYRDAPGFCWTMSDDTFSYLWQITDGSSRPLFWNLSNSIRDGWPGTALDYPLFNRPIVINNDMPSHTTTGNSPIAAGDFSKFVIRDVREATVLLLDQVYLNQLSVGYIAYLRTDSKLLNSNAVKRMVMP